MLTARGSLASFARATLLRRLRKAARLAAATRKKPNERLVHDLRVACRRAREAMAFFERVPGVPTLPDVDRAARRMAKAVRTLREIDVAIRAVRALGAGSRSSETERTRRAVLAALQRRKRSAATPRPRRVGRRAAKLEQAIAQALPGLAVESAGGPATADPGVRRFLRRRLSVEATNVKRQVRALPPRRRGEEPPYERLHRIRVGIKQWRYAEEIALLAAPKSRARGDRVTLLRRLQDAGGKTQDLTDLVDMVRTEVQALPPPDAVGAEALLSAIRRRRERAAAAFIRMLGRHLGRQKS